MKEERQPEQQADQQQAGLIDGIAQDAAREVERILSEAEKTAEERKRAARDQAKAILQQAESKAEEQAEQIRAQSTSSLRMDRRRISLRLREKAVQEVLKRVRERLAGMIGSAEYREVLLGWIVEAAIGLGAPKASVNASVAERKQIDKRLLQDAEKKITELSGKKVSLSPAEGDPLIPQGVVLRAADGRVEFNNQVATRLLRRESEIRRVIQEMLARTPRSAKARTPRSAKAEAQTPGSAKAKTPS